MEIILQEWEDFALTLHPLGSASKLQLRDHAQDMLKVICDDLDTFQAEADSIEKSKGMAAEVIEDTAAEIHASDRQISGLSIEELMAEYRAVRASVLRLWQKKEKVANELAVQDMVRFNEAIDQSLTESLTRYSAMHRDSQHVFLAILGHDVRNPLGAISMGAQVLMIDSSLPPKYLTIASRILGSAKRAGEIVADLLDFSSSHLGGGIPVTPAEMDFAAQCAVIVEEMRTLHPDRSIQLETPGDLNVIWDRARINQSLSNLIANAIHHGSKDHPVAVTVTADGDEIVWTIQNQGEILEPEKLRAVFDPAKRFAMRSLEERSSVQNQNLGLGLYITREIITAHGGKIEVKSDKLEGTTFTIRLPRKCLTAEK